MTSWVYFSFVLLITASVLLDTVHLVNCSVARNQGEGKKDRRQKGGELEGVWGHLGAGRQGSGDEGRRGGAGERYVDCLRSAHVFHGVGEKEVKGR